jgi:hypothetical protein
MLFRSSITPDVQQGVLLNTQSIFEWNREIEVHISSIEPPLESLMNSLERRAYLFPQKKQHDNLQVRGLYCIYQFAALIHLNKTIKITFQTSISNKRNYLRTSTPPNIVQIYFYFYFFYLYTTSFSK